MQLIYLALVGIWIIFQGYRLILILATIMDVAKEFIFVVIAWFMLTGAGPRLVNMIFLACLKTMGAAAAIALNRSEEHTSELQSLMRISYAVFCLNKKKTKHEQTTK